MEEETRGLSADEELAREIATVLVQANIVNAEKADELNALLSSGRMRAEDWRLYIEMGQSR